MPKQRRILELVAVLAMVAGITFLFRHRDQHSALAEDSAISSDLPDFNARGVRLGSTMDEVVKLLGPSKGDRFNENRQRYVSFGDVDLMFDRDGVSVIYSKRVDTGAQMSITAGDLREEIHSRLGEPFVPGPEPGPHRAPDYEFYRGRSCLLEVAYKGDQSTTFSLYRDHRDD